MSLGTCSPGHARPGRGWPWGTVLGSRTNLVAQAVLGMTQGVRTMLGAGVALDGDVTLGTGAGTTLNGRALARA